MSAFFRCSVLLVFCMLVRLDVFPQVVFINEILASNSGTITDEAGEYDDWVELYNPGPASVNVGGMFVTDDLGQPSLWQIPATDPAATTIPPGGFLLLWFDKQPAQGALHVNVKLSAGGEEVGLFASDGATLIDKLVFGAQTADVSYGRAPDGSSAWQFFSAPTPEAANVNSPAGDFTAMPAASVESGFFSSPFGVSLTCATPGAAIRYTLDGSEPKDNSFLYSSPISIGQTTTMRARAFATGMQPGAVATRTYFFENGHTFPVVALSFEPADFFDPATGIYPNYEENWERPVHVEFFEEDGKLAFSNEATAEIHGTGSTNLPQKSLSLKAKTVNGNGYFSYPIFPGLPFQEYKSFLLRNSGQDWNVTMFRDALVTSLAGDLSDVGDIIEPPGFSLQGFRPGIVYLNGEYWGIHNIREKLDEDYVRQHFGPEEDEIDFLENKDEAKAGDFNSWNFLTAFMNASNFSDENSFQQLGDFLDLPHFLDYNVFNILADNCDWPGNNFRRWRERTNEAKWRFLAFDFDLSFGLLDLEQDTVLWNTGDASANSLTRVLDNVGADWPNPTWATLYFRKTMENETFRRDFINRTADFLNVLFDPARVNARIDEYVALYQPEMQRHMDRWSPGWNTWDENIQKLRQFSNERVQFVRQHVIDQFAEVTGTATITLQAEPQNGGNISFSTLHLSSNRLPWSGAYFTGVKIPVTATPAPGFVFTGWSNAGMETEPESHVQLSADETLTAFFKKGSAAKDTIVINEINYNSSAFENSGDWVELFNPNSYTVDISGWVLEDESGGYFSLPDGTVMHPGDFLVLVENEEEFSAIYPQVSDYIGNFGGPVYGFKLSNDGELIQLKNANLQVIDSVRYDDQLPWQVTADGLGSTLQLINPKLDNALPQSWKANSPTPGVINEFPYLTQTIDFPAIGNQLTTAQPFTIGATATSGLPVLFSLVSGPASLAGNIVTLTGQEGIVVLKASQPGNSVWLPAPDVIRIFEVEKGDGYCLSTSSSAEEEWIERVQFGSINHLSFQKNYGNFTFLSTEAPAGSKMKLTITPAFKSEPHEEHFRAWIDFNKDGDFSDPDELVLHEKSSGEVAGEVHIPFSASLGPTRLRVAMSRGGFPEPCSAIAFGSVLDFSILITPVGSSVPNDGNPDAFNGNGVHIFPNPANDQIGARFSTINSGETVVEVINSLGVRLRSELLNLQAGEHYIELGLSGLPPGNYFLHLQPDGQRPLVSKFVKVTP